MGDQIGDRIPEEQAQSGQTQAHDQRPPQQRQIDAIFVRSWSDAAVAAAFQVQGVQIVAGGEALAGAANRVPGLCLVPGRMDADQRVAPRRALRVAHAARRAGDHAPQSALHAVDPGGDPPQSALLTCSAQFSDERLEHRLGRDVHAVPIP